MRRALLIGVLLVVALPAVALATEAGLNVSHDPPDLLVEDGPPIFHANVVDISATDRRIVVSQEKYPLASSDEACMDNDGSSFTMRCKVAGIERLEIRLDGMADQLDVDLTPHADLKQVLAGGAGGDSLRGGPGRQRILGGVASDTLRGGRGPDLLKGGPGEDDCKGGPGRDELIGCE